MATPRTISGEALVARLEDPAVLVLDVREPEEVAAWAFPGALNVPLGELEGRLEELPDAHEVVAVCAMGARATAGAALLEAAGRRALVLEGGMAAWSSTYDEAEGVFAGATVVQVRRRGKGCLSYVVGAGGRAVVIDPSLDVARYEAIAVRRGWTITHVLDTHLHADHLSGARALAAATGADLWLNPGDPFAFAFTPIADGATIELDPGVHLAVASVSVPGHTEGSTMYRLSEAAVFTGDTLFIESVGRPDLADEAEAYAHHLYRSLHERILSLPDEVAVFPAHFGPGVEVRAGRFVTRPLGELREELAPLALEEPAFVAWAIAHVKDRPGNYRRIVRVNAGREEAGDDADELETGPNRCAIS